MARRSGIFGWATGWPAWYWAFPVELSPRQVILTGVMLAVAASHDLRRLDRDPVHHTGTHKRRSCGCLRG